MIIYDKVIIKAIDEDNRVTLTHKELLGTWEENAEVFSVGETVSGIIRSVENYGIFIELAPNLAGLAELRDDRRAFFDLKAGNSVSVYIKSIIPEKMKIKLVLIDVGTDVPTPTPIQYFIDTSKEGC